MRTERLMLEIKPPAVVDVWAVWKRRQMSVPNDVEAGERTETIDPLTLKWLEERQGRSGE